MQPNRKRAYATVENLCRLMVRQAIPGDKQNGLAVIFAQTRERREDYGALLDGRIGDRYSRWLGR
jgi:hypothetical protein